MYKFKAKDSEIKPYPLFHYVSVTFQNILHSIIWKKTELKGIPKFFSIDYNPINTSHILDIYRFLMKEM